MNDDPPDIDPDAVIDPEAFRSGAFAAAARRQLLAPIRTPVAVVGPRQASAAQIAAARAVGAGIARLGLALICGGRAGVMEGACRGAAEAGGIAIGLLPDDDPASANPHATVVLPSGIGDARNVVIARTAFCVVAIGDNLGTLSEVALALQFGKRVIGLEGAARLAGIVQVATPYEAIARVAECVLSGG